MGNEHCNRKLSKIPKNIMTLHGLWPSLSSGNQLADCNQGNDIEIVDDGSEIFKFMEVYWMSVFDSNEKFWEHEYNKHGYCFSQKTNNFDYKNYFIAVMNLFKKYDLENIVTKAFGEVSNQNVSYSFAKFKESLQKVAPELMFDISCQSKHQVQYLKEIRFYFSQDFEPVENKAFRGGCQTNKDITVIYK